MNNDGNIDRNLSVNGGDIIYNTQCFGIQLVELI